MVKAKFFCPISNNLIVFNTGERKLRTIFSKTPLSMKKFASFSSNFPGGIIFGKKFNYLRVFIVVEFISRFVLERVIYYAEKIKSKSKYFKSILFLKAILPKTGVQIILRPYLSSRNSEYYSLPE